MAKQLFWANGIPSFISTKGVNTITAPSIGDFGDNTGVGEIIKFGSGTTAAGKLYYLHTTGAWTAVDADAVASGATQLLAIALGTAPSADGMLIKGVARIDTGYVNGTPVVGKGVYISEEVGEFDFAVPSGTNDFIRAVGYCLATTGGDILISFDPSQEYTELPVASGGTTINNATANELVTVASDTDELDAEANLTFNGTTLALTGNETISPANDVGAAALTVTNIDTNQIALDINASNIDANVIDVAASALTTGKALHIDHNDTATTAVTPTTVHIDFDKSGVTADGVESIYTALDIDMNDAATNHANSLVGLIGLDIDIAHANAQGTMVAAGASIKVTGADVNYGLEVVTTDGAGEDVRILSSADDDDYFSITTGTAGATTIATVDDGGATAHLTLEPDGHILLDAGTGKVGIGGTPTTILHVKAVDPRIRAEATAGNHPGFELAEAAARKWIIYNQPDSGAGGDADSLIFKGSTDSDRFEITATGEVLSSGSIKIKEAAAAVADTAAYGQIWVKTATPNQLYFTTDAGNDIQITSGDEMAGGGGDGAGELAELSDVAYTGGNLTITSLATITAGALAIDSSGDITLDADGDQVTMKFGGAAGQIDFSNENSGDGIIQQKVDAKDLVLKQFDGYEVARVHDNGGFGYRKRIVSVDGALDLSSVATAIPYSGAVLNVEQASAYAITLPTAASDPEGAKLTGWHISVIIGEAGSAGKNTTIVRGDTSNDILFGAVAAGDAASSAITISANLDGTNTITFVTPLCLNAERVDITCLGADASATMWSAQGVCNV